MTNKYWNHDNPFIPGTVVRADEANDKFDGIEVGFDRIEGITDAMAHQIKLDVMADVQPQLDAHQAQVTQDFNNLKGTTNAELQAFSALLSQLDQDMRDRLAKVLIMPDGVNNYVIPGRTKGNEIPYIDAQGNAAMLALPTVTVPADWAKVYLGSHPTAPKADSNGDPLRDGAMYYNSTQARLEVYRNGKWEPGFISGSGVVFVGNVQPASPKQGDLWFDTQTADLMLWYDDGNSEDWVVLNSNYNALFGPGIGPVLKDGSVCMEAPLCLSKDDPGPNNAISREFFEDYLRQYAGPGTILAPHITAGIDPRSNFPVQPGTADYEKPYDVRIPGTILFFGNYGALNADYGAELHGQVATPGDYVISTGREWIFIQKGGGGFITAEDFSLPYTGNTADLVDQDFYMHNGGPNAIVHPSWIGAGGATVNPGDTVIWDGTSFHVVPELRNLDRYLLRDGTFPMQGDLEMNGHRVVGAANPTGPNDLVTLTYLQTFGQNLLVPWTQVTGKPVTFPPIVGPGPADAAAGDHLHDARYFQKIEFVDATTGAADAGKPVILDASGHIPTDMVTLPSFTTFKGAIDPANLPANPGLGDFYVLSASGVVGGVPSLPGDMIVWDGTDWNVIAAEAELAAFLMLDGSRPMAGPMDLGGFVINNVGNPVAPQDAVNLRTMENDLRDYLLIDGTRAMTGDLDMGAFKVTEMADADVTVDTDGVNVKTLHDEAFQKTEHIDTSTGAADAGKPIVLGSIGRIPINMLSLPSVLRYKGTVAPGSLPANAAIGDVYVFNAVGVQDGINVHPGDWALFDGTIWEIVPAIQDLSVYVNRDGSTPMLGAFNAGNFKILNVAAPTVNADAANKKYVDDQLGATTVPWNRVTNKPATFPPTIGTGAADAAAGNHVHAWADITGKPVTFPPTIGTSATTAAAGNHAHTWAQITGKPTTWAWANISGKPSLLTLGTTATTAAAGNHSHSWAQITGKPALLALGTTATTAAAGNHTHAGLLSGLTANRLMIGATATSAKTGNLQTDAAGTRIGIGVAPAQALHVNGQIVATNDITAFFSDMRLKTNLTGLTNALDRIDRIDAFTYQPNEKALELGAATDAAQRVGVSAQDVERELPEAVSRAPFDMTPQGGSKTGEDYLTVDYSKLVPLLLQGVKDLRQEIADLQQEIEDLKK